MRVPLGWLAEWVPLPPVEPLVERLTLGGLEIEEVIRSGPDLSALRVGAVVSREPHPDADRLSLCQVDVGGGEVLAIVCGAPNVAAGQKVAVAVHGTVLPDGGKIKRSKIRGVVSNGMICSARELGLGDDHGGILVLDPQAPVGAALSQVLSAGDVVLDVEITPNRGDWVSMLGMAREVRAHFGGEVRVPETEPAEAERPAAADVAVDIADPAGCRRYVARVVRGVRVGPSPDWLRHRLEQAGLRSINNIVDVTNLVMFELGQPLHAFDLDRLRGGRIGVRAAAAGEKIVTLDGQTREAAADDLLIVDGEGPVAVAGVMGGAESEVSEATTAILLESADFAPERIRRTAKRLGLHSDASYRFERGVDPDGQARAADRAARLIQELAGGEVSRGRVEARGEAAPRTEEIRLEVERVNHLLGTALSQAEVVDLLARVDVGAEVEAPGRLLCKPPRYRRDLHLAADLVEEVARIHGYDRIESALPSGTLGGVSIPPGRPLVEGVRDALVGCGLTEIMTFPGARDDDADALRLEAGDPRRRGVRILNPIQAAEPRLRTALLPSVLRAVQANRSRQVDDLRVFEVGRVFRVGAPGGLPEERVEAVAFVCEGGAPDLWGTLDSVPVFFRAKGIGERLLADLERDAAFRAGSREPFLHPGAAGELAVGGRTVASVGELHPETAAAFGIDVPAAVLVLDVDALGDAGASPPRYREVSRQPRVQRDLALLVPADAAAGDLLAAIRGRAGAALASVVVFDRYEGKGVPAGKVSLAFRLTFQRADRTLTDPEISAAVERVVQVLSRDFGGELRTGTGAQDASGRRDRRDEP